MISRILTLAAFLPLAACGAPFVAPNAPSAQHKLTHAEHWRQAADRTVAQLIAQVAERPELATAGGAQVGTDEANAVRAANTFYIEPIAPDMPFSALYTEYLTEAITERGYLVTNSPGRAIVINTEVKTFLYGNQGKIKIDYPGFWGAVAATGILLTDVEPWGTGEAALTVAAAGAVLQVLGDLTDRTNAEVVLTTSVLTDHHTVYSDVEPFYVQPSDLPFYWSQFPQTALRTTSVQGDRSLRTVTLPVTR